MFERLEALLRARGEERADLVARRLAERAGEILPRDLQASPEEHGIRFSGKGLNRRMTVDPALRGLWQRLR